MNSNQKTKFEKFEQEELAYYARHLSLESIGMLGQQKLKSARVLCVGAGGLGCPLLLYLAGAGVGKIAVIDDDKVELSNLHRQVLYTMDDVHLSKADRACQKINQLNPYIETVSYPFRLTADNASEIIASYDIVADCSDNFATRYLVNDVCFQLQKPNVQASISQFEGSCTVLTVQDGPCYRCLFDVPPPANFFQNCAEAGVMGVLPGLLGSIQAMEVIKLIVGAGVSLVGRLLTLDALTMTFKELAFEKNPECLLCHHQQPFEKLARPIQVCSIPVGISPAKLKALQQQQSIFILDVREPHEYAAYNLGGYLIPLQELPHRLSELNSEDTIVVHCRTNPRSQVACEILKQAGFKFVLYLDGGIVAWQAEDQTSQQLV